MKYLSIHLTDLCNSACTFCVVASPLYTSETVEYESVERFLKENSGKGFEIVNLHGGEPTTHPKFIDTLLLIQKLGYREVHLQTNGLKLAVKGFTQKLIDMGVSRFIVSLHGDSDEVQDRQTGTTGGYKKTLEGIRNIKLSGGYVRTNTVITTQNVNRLYPLTQLACDLEVDHINYSNLHPVGSARYALGRILPTFQEIRNNLYPAIDVALSRERRVTLEGFPYCMVREKMDLHLHNEHRKVRMLMRGEVIENYDSFMNKGMRIYGTPCERCILRDLCGGVYPQYIEYRGWDEFSGVEEVTKLSQNDAIVTKLALQRILTR